MKFSHLCYKSLKFKLQNVKKKLKKKIGQPNIMSNVQIINIDDYITKHCCLNQKLKVETKTKICPVEASTVGIIINRKGKMLSSECMQVHPNLYKILLFTLYFNIMWSCCMISNNLKPKLQQ